MEVVSQDGRDKCVIKGAPLAISVQIAVNNAVLTVMRLTPATGLPGDAMENVNLDGKDSIVMKHVVLGCLDQTAKANVAATVEELNLAII